MTARNQIRGVRSRDNHGLNTHEINFWFSFGFPVARFDRDSEHSRVKTDYRPKRAIEPRLAQAGRGFFFCHSLNSRTARPRLVTLQPCKGRYANGLTRTAGRLTGPLKETPSAASNAVSHASVMATGFRLVKVRRETPKVPKARPSGDALYRRQAPERGLLSETQAEPATIGSMNQNSETFTLSEDAQVQPFAIASGFAPLKFAYADPPYFGLSEKFYGHLHTEAADYDKLETHAALIARMCEQYDGWALSLNTPSLRDILPLCPPDVRVMAWVKPFASFKPGVGVAYAWEPIIVRGGRRRTREQHTVRDWHACNITLRRGFTGTKPESVIRWLLEVWNAQKTDTIDDLFPGSGAVSIAFNAWKNELTLWETAK